MYGPLGQAVESLAVGFRRLVKVGTDFGRVVGDDIGDCQTAVVVAAG